jgi:hypothetical protein
MEAGLGQAGFKIFAHDQGVAVLNRHDFGIQVGIAIVQFDHGANTKRSLVANADPFVPVFLDWWEQDKSRPCSKS